MRSILGGCALAGLLLAGPVHADEPGAFNAYVGVAAGRSSVKSKVFTEEKGDPIAGWTLGYMVNPNVSVEVVARLLSFRLLDGLLGDTNFYPATHAGVAVLGSMPVSSAINVYGRIGIGRTTLEADTQPKTDDHIADPSVGVGAVFGTTGRVGVKLEATRFTKSQVTTTMLGLEVRF